MAVELQHSNLQLQLPHEEGTIGPVIIVANAPVHTTVIGRVVVVAVT